MEILPNKISSKKSYIYSALIFIPLAWGTTFVLLKEIVSTTDPNLLIFYRFGIASVILAAIAGFKKLQLLQNLKSGILLGIVIWIAFVSQFFGLKYTTIANSAFITGMFIVFIPLLSWLINGSQIKTRHLAAVFMSLAGLWFLTGGINKLNFGDLLTVITALAAATHVVLCEKFMSQNNNPLVLNLQQMTVSCLLSLIFFLLFNKSLNFSVSLPNFAAILYLAVIATVGAYLAQLWVQKYSSAMTVSLFFTLEPVFAVLCAYLYSKELLTLPQILGCAVMILAVVFMEIDFKKYLYAAAGK